MKQTGRKQKHHIVTATEVCRSRGLPAAQTGRWRVIGARQTLREPDEQKVIARFRELMGEKLYEGLPPEEIEWLRTPASAIVDGNDKRVSEGCYHGKRTFMAARGFVRREVP